MNLTVLDGRLSTSPIPPPFRNPWFNVVTIHMMSVSHARSLIELPSSSFLEDRLFPN